jgi:hypothetical protein
MVDLVKQLLTAQFEGSLCMLHHGIRTCPPAHWEGKIAIDSFRQVAYHTLFFADFYLAPTESSFALRELHQRGGDERQPVASVGLTQDETLSYAAICRQRAIDTLAAETEESLKRPSGFSRRNCSRCELHFYNIRHIQHHVGQMSAYLRRVADQAIPWIGAGWKG